MHILSLREKLSVVSAIVRRKQRDTVLRSLTTSFNWPAADGRLETDSIDNQLERANGILEYSNRTRNICPSRSRSLILAPFPGSLACSFDRAASVRAITKTL